MPSNQRLDPNGIAQKAIVATLRITHWRGAHFLRIPNDETPTPAAKSLTSKIEKQIQASPEFKNLRHEQTSLRAAFHDHTMKWQPEGSRLIAVAHYPFFDNLMSERISSFITSATHLADLVESHQKSIFEDPENAASRRSEILSQFTATLTYSAIPPPLPQTGALDALSPEAAAVLIENARKSLEANIEIATQSEFDHLRQPLTNYVDRVSKFRIENGRPQNSFKKSTIDVLSEAATRLPEIGITKDPELLRICAEVEQDICSVPADVLRTDHALRAKMLENAEKIIIKLAKMSPLD